MIQETKKREIKFRAWDGNKMIFTERSEFCFNSSFSTVQIPSSTGHEFYDRDYPFMQITGLTDKNGKEIYEGDILTFVTYRGGGFATAGIQVYGEVVFGTWKNTPAFVVKGRDGHLSEIGYWLRHGSETAGNIYEHPNLLN